MIDADVPQMILEHFASIGFTVVDAKRVFPIKTDDRVIARAAEANAWIVVTKNQTDFRRMLARARRSHEQHGFYRAGAIFLQGFIDSTRLRQCRRTILCEMANAELRNDRRVFIEICGNRIAVEW